MFNNHISDMRPKCLTAGTKAQWEECGVRILLGMTMVAGRSCKQQRDILRKIKSIKPNSIFFTLLINCL